MKCTIQSHKSFDDAYNNAIPAKVTGHPVLRYSALKLEDLIASKAKAGRPIDFLDIQELKRVNQMA
jgi:predicted nucleotidyltransferase